MVSESYSVPAGQTPQPTTQGSHVGTWIQGLRRFFDRIALFKIEGTDSHLVGVHGVPLEVMGRSISLVEQTPLRWAVEAASPIVQSGQSPGGQRLVAALGVTPPRAFILLPVVVRRRLVALAYCDRGDKALSLGTVSEVFAYCSTLFGVEGWTPHAPKRCSVQSTRQRLRHGGNREPGLRTIRREVPPEPESAPEDPTPPIPTSVAIENHEGAPVHAEAKVPSPSSPSGGLPSPWQAPPPALPELTGGGAPTKSPAASLPLPLPVPEPLPRPNRSVPVLQDYAFSNAGLTAMAVVTPEGVVAPAQLRQGATARSIRRLRRWLGGAAAGALLVAVGLLMPLSPPGGAGRSKPGHGVLVSIAPAWSVPDIAAHLEQRELIRSPRAFGILAALTGSDRALKAGTYRIPTGVWAWTVMETLERGQVTQVSVTIPEGFTLVEVARTLEKAGLAPATDILRLARDPRYLRARGVPGPSLEGFLFPETYTFAVGLTAVEILNVMVDEFFARLAKIDIATQVGRKELLEKVTLASVIERETQSKTELRRVAGVFHNRLQRGQRLESCATVQYVLGEPKKRLTLQDIRIPSPYNTYLNEGLPPGPIANPSAGALRAAFYPENHDYLFFLARHDGSGRHIFSRTFEAHQRAQRRHLRRR